ncbi:MAG: hypothetical protein ACTH2Y_00780 [Corynebacterium sp.]|uniref:hypothetical protein n=1 Tax=unclassified Corynebacterium TaxID=2624378 RepID=UPI002647C1A0|nr:hypothetical protein [Corynebacterium sp.]MDN5582283.1 hypothetical protein [Corynebacterium sp.]MDN5720373.1 hypothetical protein [Corynebacterium sp.]MDN6325168.1 hypothetical protein [Corynebacterium sp.]MDN6510273.1 hypothetical protein [Corynebacterium sp.]
MRTSRQIAPDRKVRRRREWEDTRRPAWVMWLSVLCLVALAGTVIALAGSDRMSQPQAINGDMLGPDNSETLDEYVARAGTTLQDTPDTGDTGDEARWALVTPVEPAGTQELTEIFSGMSGVRVSTLLYANSRWEIAEPADGHRREDVFAGARDQVAANAGVGEDDPALDVLGVLVHAAPDDLAALDDREDVLAVEALPPDASYGRFGLRPVTAEEREQAQEQAAAR